VATSFAMKVSVPEHVLIRELDGESVLLNLESECYVGLDEVGTRMWAALTTGASVQAAFEELMDEYEVDAERLRGDLTRFIRELVEQGLVTVRAE
jgi:hypothetical protein